MRAMIPAEERFDERFASLLAQYEAKLTTGAPADTSQFSSLADPRLAGRLVKAGECLELLEQVWPRPRAQAPDGEPPPEAVDRFEVIRELGRGGFGIVYLAFDPVLQREIALKVQRPETVLSPELRRRFLGEAQAAGALNHPNIVAVYEVGEASVLGWIAVEYCPGMSLAEWLARWQTPVPPRLAAEFVAQLADAVAYAHSRGILHRDIKPSNVLLVVADERVAGADRSESSADSPDAGGSAASTSATNASEPCFDGGGAPCPPEASMLAREAAAFLTSARPKLTDFGLAKVLDGDAVETKSGTLIGTPGYMAPEQIESSAGEVGPATDVYGLGLVLYEMLTAKPAVSGTTRAETFKRVLLEEPAAPRKLCRQVPRDLQAITLEAIAKKPGQRYFSAAELAIDLRRYLADKPVRARQPRWYEHAWRFVRRRPAWVTAATLLVIAGCLIAAVTRYSAENRALLGLRTVSFTTEPPDAQVVFVPLSDINGELDPSRAVRPRGRTPIHVDLRPGDYFVVASLDKRRFHEVYRHVPAGNMESRNTMFKHQNWTMQDGEVVLPNVKIPLSDVCNGMALIEAGEAGSEESGAQQSSFYMDSREFTNGDYASLRGHEPDREEWESEASMAHERALKCSFDVAVAVAEDAGKRLPTLDEYRVAASRRTPEARKLGELTSRADDFGPAGFPNEDRTDTVPPVFGLYSNFAEWTVTRSRLGIMGTQFIFGGDWAVVGGNPSLAREHRAAGDLIAVDRNHKGPGLGFRCVRSAYSRYLSDDH
jgi:serine/threonine protein kinase